MRTESVRLGFHLAAELVTAIWLVASVAGLLQDRGWGREAGLVAAGLLLYMLIVSPGYFAQSGNWAMAGDFGLLVVIDLPAIYCLLKHPE